MRENSSPRAPLPRQSEKETTLDSCRVCNSQPAVCSREISATHRSNYFVTSTRVRTPFPRRETRFLPLHRFYFDAFIATLSRHPLHREQRRLGTVRQTFQNSFQKGIGELCTYGGRTDTGRERWKKGHRLLTNGRSDVFIRYKSKALNYWNRSRG